MSERSSCNLWSKLEEIPAPYPFRISYHLIGKERVIEGNREDSREKIQPSLQLPAGKQEIVDSKAGDYLL